MEGEEGKGVPEGYVKLVSGDGFEFLVEEEYACVSNVIKTMLASKFVLMVLSQVPDVWQCRSNFASCKHFAFFALLHRQI